MAASGPKLNLIIQVLPLEEENSHGQYREVALQTFKARRFKLTSVPLEDAIESVWTRIEERYKRDYLTSAQASNFSIKVLQDADDCDIDVSDTVEAIFGGEPDQSRRLIKVVPTFVYRDFSVPFTSNLRPASAQKRARETVEQTSNKRRRLESETQQLIAEDLHNGRDRPLPSTESDGSGENGQENGRSQSASSLVFMRDSRTGRPEFVEAVKEESPELSMAPMQTIPPSEKEIRSSPRHPFRTSQLVPTQSTGNASRIPDSPTPGARRESQMLTPRPSSFTAINQTILNDDTLEDAPPSSAEPAARQESLVHQSPVSFVSQRAPSVTVGRPTLRKDIYEPSSSPDAFHSKPKPRNTYGRSNKTPKKPRQQTLQEAVSRRRSSNGSESRSTSVNISEEQRSRTSSISSRARVFQHAHVDEIVSTPGVGQAFGDPPSTAITSVAVPSENPNLQGRSRNSHGTPSTDAGSISEKSSTLKKPTRTSFQMPKPSLKGVSPRKATPQHDAAAKTRRSSTVTDKTTPVVIPQKPIAIDTKTPSGNIGSRRGSNARSSMSGASMSPTLSQTPGGKKARLAELRARMQSKSQAQTKNQPPMTNQSQVKTRRSPSVVISRPTKTARGQNLSQVSQPSSVPSIDRGNGTADVATESAPVHTLHETQSTPQKEYQTESSKQATANGIMASEESPRPTEEGSPDIEQSQPLHAEGSPVNSTQVPAGNGSLDRRSSSPTSKREPGRSHVPLPGNVRHLAGPGELVSTDRTPVPIARSTPRKSPSETIEQTVQATGHNGSFPSPHEEAIVLSSNVSSPSSDESDTSDEEQDEGGETEAGAQDEAHSGTALQNGMIQPAESQELGSLPDAESESEFESESDSESEDSSSSEDEGEPADEQQAQDITQTSEPTSFEPTSDKVLQHTPSWNFNGIGQEQSDNEEESKTKIGESRSSRSSSTSSTESESDAEVPSKSVSGANSRASSPAVSRGPARVLTHSPTPESSSSEDEDGEDDAAQPTAPTEAEQPGKASDSDSDTDSDSDSSSDNDSDSSSDSDSDEDVEMVDAETQDNKTVSGTPVPPSSPPLGPSQAQRRIITHPIVSSQRMQTSSSQSLPRASQNGTSSVRASPRVSGSYGRAGGRTSAPPIARPSSQRFPSLRDQLNSALSTPLETPKATTFDPRTTSLTALTKGKTKGKLAYFDEDEEDDDDDESSSSSSEDEAPTTKAGCSVA